MKIGRHVYRLRWWVAAAWLGGAVALVLAVGGIDPSANEPDSFLPQAAPYSEAIAAMRESFPDNSGLSEAVVVFERRAGELTGADLEAAERIGAGVRRACSDGGETGPLAGVTVRSPRSIPLPKKKNPLVSSTGQATLIIVNVPADFVTLRSSNAVERIRSIVSETSLPPGLSVAVTGSSGLGHDYAEAAKRSHRRTLYVTLAAVILILLLVYRAPIAAMVPLVGISIAAVVALKLLAVGTCFGMHVGTAETIFVIVLLYGAGTDYSLLLISRCRELLADSASAAEAAAGALDATFPAILASAGTDAGGLAMLSFAQFAIFRTTGPAVAAALLVALLSAVTLVPALVGIAGHRLFWPGRGRTTRPPWFWPRVARTVTHRPGLVLVVVLAVLAVPAARALRLTWVYDTLAAVKGEFPAGVGNAAAGIEMTRRHWPVGEIAPVRILLRDRTDRRRSWREISRQVTAAVAKVPGVRNVRSLTQPLGAETGPATRTAPDRPGWFARNLRAAMVRLMRPMEKPLKKIARQRVEREYLSGDRRATRLAAILDVPPMSLAAMETVENIRRTVEAVKADRPLDLHIVGATAEVIEIRTVTRTDFRNVAALTLAVIFTIVLVLLRDAILSAFMLALTVMGYMATLGISYWVLAGLFGAAGLDWKVQVFLFVVMVAVGVDYSIFLAARLSQEARSLPGVEATQKAVIHTGPVISSCGLIMAATLGSLMAGQLTLLKQLGFALALGMLIDTFIIRPLLLPALAVLTKRAGRSRKWIG